VLLDAYIFIHVVRWMVGFQVSLILLRSGDVLKSGPENTDSPPDWQCVDADQGPVRSSMAPVLILPRHSLWSTLPGIPASQSQRYTWLSLIKAVLTSLWRGSTATCLPEAG
jgi:hypothetical protein